MPACSRHAWCPDQHPALRRLAPSTPALRLAPCTITAAKQFVAEHHRHRKNLQGGLWAVAVRQLRRVAGVAVVGRPVARLLQDGVTAEVTRVCTTAERNACSMLYGACRRAAIALGYRRLITYTLASEDGASLRASGWVPVAETRAQSWDRDARPRADHAKEDKIRWEATL